MCEATTIGTIVSLAAAGTGTVLQQRASSQQADAMKQENASEQRRQSGIMRDQMRLQEQQRQDALEARKKFQTGTLDAYTREGIEKDQQTQQTRIGGALKAAGERAVPVASGDATRSTGNVRLASADPTARDARSEGTASYRNALAQAAQRAAGVNAQQAGTQGALLALGRAQQMGGERLQTAGQGIQLSNARLGVLNPPRQALGLLSGASTQLYGSRAEDAANEGAGLALAGSTLQALGNVGYSYASKGIGKNQPVPVT